MDTRKTLIYICSSVLFCICIVFILVVVLTVVIFKNKCRKHEEIHIYEEPSFLEFVTVQKIGTQTEQPTYKLDVVQMTQNPIYKL